MFPPWVSAIWQSLAHSPARPGFGFARLVPFAQDIVKTLVCFSDGLFCDDCYPSPYPWPGPLWVRPSLPGRVWHRFADLVVPRSFGFQLPQNAVESASIKTIIRGSVTCGNRPLSSWRFVRPPFQPVLRMTLNAAASARLAVPSSAKRSGSIRLPVRLSAVLAVWCATTWAFANNTGQAGHQSLAATKSFKTTRANRPGGFFVFRGADSERSEGRQCSKRY